MKEFEVRPKEYTEIQSWDEDDELMVIKLSGNSKYTALKVSEWYKVYSNRGGRMSYLKIGMAYLIGYVALHAFVMRTG